MAPPDVSKRRSGKRGYRATGRGAPPLPPLHRLSRAVLSAAAAPSWFALGHGVNLAGAEAARVVFGLVVLILACRLVEQPLVVLQALRGGAALKQLTIRSDDLDGEGLAAVIAAIAGCIIDGLLPELTKLSIGGRSSDEELWDLLPRPTLFALLAALCFGSNLERHFVGHVVCALKRRRAVERLQRAFTRARRARAMAAELNKLCRKVREVEQLEARRESGKELQPNQLTKLAKAAEFRAQLAACFASSSITDATSSATAPTAPSEAAGPAQDQVLPAWQIALLSGAYAD